MKVSLSRFFKKEKAAAAPISAPAPLEKPASERFGKTVMPNMARVFEPAPAPGMVSLGERIPAGERTVALHLADLLPQIPAELLEEGAIEPGHRVRFNATQLERGMANGRPVVPLRSIYEQAPKIFASEVQADDEREVTLPFDQVLLQFASLQVRGDQVSAETVPEVETPFSKATLEDSERFGTPSTPVPPTAPRVEFPAAADAAPAPTAKLPTVAPIRLPVPSAPPSSAATPATAEPPAPTASRKVRFSPNGTGVPASERVPASSGPSVPTPLPSPFAPPAPARIPFKITPPASDLCPAPELPLKPLVAAKSLPLAFSDAGPRLRLSLRAVLRELPPFQFSEPLEKIPESAQIELPFGIVQPQLALGRIAISPAQFYAAMPEEFRPLFKLDEGGMPVALPLPEVLQNLPNESLQLRGDQEETEVEQLFETPFSQKAAEDAERMKVPAGPIAKEAVVAGGVDPGESDVASPNVLEATDQPGSTPPATMRTPLQVALDTDETLDAKSIVTHASRLPGVRACAIVFSDGLSLAGNIPADYEADALCAIAPEIVKRIDDQMVGAHFGALQGITLFCAKTPVSFFAHGNICLAALHSAGGIAAEIRDRLSCTTQELARMYAEPA